MKAWSILNVNNGSLIYWAGAQAERSMALDLAVRGLMGSRDYERLGNHKARWRFLYRQGYRLVRVRVELERRPGEPKV